MPESAISQELFGKICNILTMSSNFLGNDNLNKRDISDFLGCLQAMKDDLLDVYISGWNASGSENLRANIDKLEQICQVIDSDVKNLIGSPPLEVQKMVNFGMYDSALIQNLTTIANHIAKFDDKKDGQSA